MPGIYRLEFAQKGTEALRHSAGAFDNGLMTQAEECVKADAAGGRQTQGLLVVSGIWNDNI
jgi:hypothetical protein